MERIIRSLFSLLGHYYPSKPISLHLALKSIMPPFLSSYWSNIIHCKPTKKNIYRIAGFLHKFYRQERLLTENITKVLELFNEKKIIS